MLVPFHLTRLEWRVLAKEPGTWIIVTLMMIASITGIINGFSPVSHQQQLVAEARNEQKKQYENTLKGLQAIEEKRNKNGDTEASAEWISSFPPAARAEIYNFKAVLPAPPLAAIGFGQTDLFPQSLETVNNTDDRPSFPTVNNRILSNVLPEKNTESPLRFWLGKWDLTFVLVFLYPLFVLALSYDFISADRESGTLALALAQGVSLRVLAAVRFTIRAILFLIAGVVIPAAAIVLGQAFIHLPADPVRLALWIAFASAYILFWLAAALVINLRGHSATGNALFLIILWTALTLLVPAGIGFAVRTLAPITPSIWISDAERAARNHANEVTTQAYHALVNAFNQHFPLSSTTDANLKKERERKRFTDPFPRPQENAVLEAFFAAHPSYGAKLTHFQVWYATQLGRDLFVEKELSPALTRLHQEKDRQNIFMSVLSYLSPPLQLKQALDDIAGTSSARHRCFLAQFDQYVRNREAWFTKKIAARSDIQASEFLKLPLFEYQEEPDVEVIKRTIAPLFYLWILCGAFLWWGFHLCQTGRMN